MFSSFSLHFNRSHLFQRCSLNSLNIVITLSLCLPSCFCLLCTFYVPFRLFLPLKRRSISERQDAVQEIMNSGSLTLNSIRSLLSHLPDLERGICSIYHRKVIEHTCTHLVSLEWHLFRYFFASSYFLWISNHSCQILLGLSCYRSSVAWWRLEIAGQIWHRRWKALVLFPQFA